MILLIVVVCKLTKFFVLPSNKSISSILIHFDLV